MYTGKEPFTFWFGVIEDRLDPLELGRYRVRVLGYHPEFKKDLPTERLPWAQVIQPIHSASLSGKGISPVGFVEGSWVVGFFADGQLGQIPIIFGSIWGMNVQTSKDDNFGDGFKDPREDLSIFPVDEFKKKEYPDGKGKRGDNRGAQLENEDESEKYPRPEYSWDSSGRSRGTPDLNILAINDIVRIDKTIVPLKRTPISKGLRDVAIDVADCKTDKFFCGVTNESFVNRGTIKGLGIGNNRQRSSSVPSKKEKSKQFVDKPTNNNNIRVDSSKTMDLGGFSLSSALGINFNVPTLSDIGLA